MKDRVFTLLLAAAGLLAGLQAVKAQKVVLHMAGNQTFECSISQLDSITFVGDDLIIEEEHEWVDLGLPSGTLWATCNVGANSPEEYGDYFAWGETEPKDNYNWSTYKYCKGSENSLTKYCFEYFSGYNGFTDNITELLSEDDAATANWGDGWQMPSIEQLEELINENNTSTIWITQKDIYGQKIMSKINGKSIFLPASGYYAAYNNEERLYDVGCRGIYWSRSLYESSSSYALGLSFGSSSYIGWNGDYRCFGRSVRPVRVKE